MLKLYHTIMVEKLANTILTIKPIDVFNGLSSAWLSIFKTQPKTESILCLMAQSALETGRWKSIHCYNFGNIKSRDGDGRDYTFYACNELMATEQAKVYVSKNPDTAKITAVRNDGKAWIWFYPEHPASRFRAFKTLQEGAVDYLVFLNTKFKKAWEAVEAGDPVTFSKALKKNGYYTADESAYTKGLKLLFDEFKKTQASTTTNTSTGLTQEQITRVNNLVALTLQEMSNNIDRTSPHDD